MLTTPPGPYLVTLALRPFMQVLGFFRACDDVMAIRSTNVLALLSLPLLCMGVLRARGCSDPGFVPYICASLPPLWFFGFLYYTDVLSVIAIIASVGAMERKHHVQASLWGSAALFFRQTNIVWVLFIMGVAALRECQRVAGVSPRITPPITTLLVQRSAWMRIIRTVSPYAPIFPAFMLFIQWNDGAIVLGDKSHHQVALHLAQVGYFFGFALTFGWPLIFFLVPMRWGKVHAMVSVVLLTMGVLAVRYGTIVHPFLLADNRHYTFYVWRRIINARLWTRYALVPVYVFSAMSFVRILSKKQSGLWILGWLLATCLTLVPSPLIEPRYLIMPYLMMRLYMPTTTRKQEIIEWVFYMMVNALTMTLFIGYPFTWAHEPGTQRFMW